jgi:enhancer of mRNA-decapping protein 4
LSTADNSLREAILKMSQSKQAMDAMGQSLAATLQPILQAAFKDTFATVIVPAFERSTQHLFTSVATTFNKGCKDYEGQLKQHLGKQVYFGQQLK